MATERDMLGLLDGRKGLDPLAWSYKLANAPGYGMDTNIGDLEFDQASMSMWIPIADGQRRDGVGDLLEVEGIDLSRHRKNPIVLFDHGKQVTLPIGMAQEDPADPRTYTVEIDPVTRQCRLNAFFYQGKGLPGVDKGDEYDHAVFCEQLYDMAVKRFIRGGSIGYQVKEAREIPADYERCRPRGLHLLRLLMLEGSLVVLPANADTAIKVLSMPRLCGKPLSPYLVKSLECYGPHCRKAQLGYEGKQAMRPDEETYLSLEEADSPQGSLQKIRRKYRTPVPTGDLSKTDVPPVKWKPGVGAAKACCGGCKAGTGCESGEDKAMPVGPNTKVRLKRRGGGVGGNYVTTYAGDGECDFGHLDMAQTFPMDRALQVIREAAKKGVSLVAEEVTGSKAFDPHAYEVVQQRGQWWVGTRMGLSHGAGIGPFASKEEAQAEANKRNAKRQGADKVTGERKSLDPEDANGKPIKVGDTVYILTTKETGKVIRIKPGGYPVVQVGSSANAWQSDELEVRRAHGGDPLTGQRKSLEAHTKASPDVFKGILQRLGPGESKTIAGRKVKRNSPPNDPRFAQTARFTIDGSELMSLDEAANELAKGSKSLDVRKKYRTSKGLKKTLRKGMPGSALIHVDQKDMEAAGTAMRAKGIKWKWKSEGDGVVKVKMTGPDEAMDEVAKDFGQPMRGFKSLEAGGAKAINYDEARARRELQKMMASATKDVLGVSVKSDANKQNFSVAGGPSVGLDEAVRQLVSEWRKQGKSLSNQRTKDMDPELEDPTLDEELDLEAGGDDVEEELPGEGQMDLPDEVVEEKDYSHEPIGSQILRRLHGDHGMLMKDYDAHMGMLEPGSPAHAHMLKYMQNLEKSMQEIEKLHAKTYKDLEPIAGMIDDKDADLDAPEEEPLSEEDLDEFPEEEGKDIDTEETDSVPADSTQEELPTEDEVAEEMGSKSIVPSRKELKTLRGKYKAIKGKAKQMPGEVANAAGGNPSGDVPMKGLPEEHRGAVGEASGFLKDAGQEGSDWGEEHRFKAYHYHKTLDGIASVKGADSLGGDESAVPGEEESPVGEMGEKRHKIGRKSQIPGDLDYWQEEGEEPEHWQKMCKGASGFLKELSASRNFGDPHRAKALNWHKELEGLMGGGEKEMDPEDPGQDEDAAAEATFGGPDEGGMSPEGKSLLRTFKRQGEIIEDLNGRVSALLR